MHWRRKWQPTPVILPGESQGQGSLAGFCLWGRTEPDTTEATQQQQQQGFPGGSEVKNLPASAGDTGSVPGFGRSPGERKGTHSNILAWRIPWTEEPSGLQSVGLQKAGHD